MKTINKRYLLTIVFAAAISIFSYAQKMGELTKIKYGSKAIDLPFTYAAPYIYDYDKNGLNDLVVGNKYGKFRVYLNIGSKNKPYYKHFTFIRAGGKDAHVDNW